MSFTGLTTKPPQSLVVNALEWCREVKKSTKHSLSALLADTLFLFLARLRRKQSFLMNNFPSWYLYIFKDKRTWVSYSMERQNTATHLPMLCVYMCVCEGEEATQVLLLVLLLPPPPLHTTITFWNISGPLNMIWKKTRWFPKHQQGNSGAE